MYYRCKNKIVSLSYKPSTYQPINSIAAFLTCSIVTRQQTMFCDCPVVRVELNPIVGKPNNGKQNWDEKLGQINRGDFLHSASI